MAMNTLHIPQGVYEFRIMSGDSAPFKLKNVATHLEEAMPRLRYTRIHIDENEPGRLTPLLNRDVEPESFLHHPDTGEVVQVHGKIDYGDGGHYAFGDTEGIEPLLGMEAPATEHDGRLALTWGYTGGDPNMRYRLGLEGEDPGTIVTEVSGYINDRLQRLGVDPRRVDDV